MLLTLFMTAGTLKGCSASLAARLRAPMAGVWKKYNADEKEDDIIEIQTFPQIQDGSQTFNIHQTGATDQYLYEMVIKRSVNPAWIEKRRREEQRKIKAALDKPIFKATSTKIRFIGDANIGEDDSWEECTGGLPKFIALWLGSHKNWDTIFEHAKTAWNCFNQGDKRTFQKKSKNEEQYYLLTKWVNYKCWVLERYTKHGVCTQRKAGDASTFNVGKPTEILYAFPDEEPKNGMQWMKIRDHPILRTMLSNKQSIYMRNTRNQGPITTLCPSKNIYKILDMRKKLIRNNGPVVEGDIEFGFGQEWYTWRQLQGLDEFKTIQGRGTGCYLKNFPEK